MENKHTPGPWRLDPVEGEASGYKDFEVHTDDLNHWIADIKSVHVTTESLANAKLIAAAPDMLKALQEVAEDWKNGCRCPWSIFESVEAAIKKATE